MTEPKKIILGVPIMSDFLEEYGLEMESDHFSTPMGRPTPPDPMLQPRKKGGALGKVICLVLGFVLGVGGTVGGVAGAGYMVATQRIKDTIGTIGGLVGTEIKYQDFITEKYAEQTIMGAIGEISKVAQKFSTGEGCLNDLNDISPLVSTSIDPLLKTLTDFGMDINKEDLMALPFSQFPDFFMEQLKEVELIALLGSAGVTDESPILNAICYDLDGNPTKLGIFFDEGPEGLLNNITLEAFLISADGVVDPAKDNLIMALAYGNANRYTLTEESKVVMNQKIYKRIGDTFYDIDGNEVTVGSEAGKHTVTEEEIIYYLSEIQATGGRARANEVKLYYAYEDVECTKASYYKKITLGNLIGGNASDLINGLELGSLFNISPLDENPDPITLALAYGEEGTHYNIVNNQIVWIGNNKPKTIGDLLSGDITGLLDGIRLGTLLGISPLDENPDPITLALAYGEEGTHYVIKEINGEKTIVWQVNPDAEEPGALYAPRTIGDLLAGDISALLDDIKLGTLLGVSPFDENPDPLTLALAYGEKGTHYNIINGELIWLGENKPKTVGDLLGGNVTELLNDIQLGQSLFKISPLDAYKEVAPGETAKKPDAITLAIAYGEEGTHYVLEDADKDGTPDTIKWLNDKEGNPYKPKTVGDLLEGNFTDMMNELKLGTLLSISPLDPYQEEPTTPDPIMLALAFGEVGTHYVLKEVDGEMTIEWLVNPDAETPGDTYGPRTMKDLTENANNIFNQMQLGTILGVKIDDLRNDPEADALTHAIAFGYEDTEFYFDNNGQVQWNIDPETDKPYGPRTVEDMKKMNKFMDSLRLATVLKVNITDELTDSNRLTHAIAFGYEGTDFTLDGAGNPTWKGDSYYRTVKDMSNMGDIMDTLRLATVLDIDIDEELNDSNRLTHAIAFGYEGTDFTLNSDGTPTWIGDSYYRTVNDMSTLGDIMDTLRLATVLDVDPLDSKPDDKMTLAIAYGYEGTHYDIVNNEIVWKVNPDADVPGTKYTYRTVNDMSNMGDIINDIRLETALGITHESPRLMVVLAYGSEGEGFEYVTNPVTGEITGIEVKEGSSPRTIADLNDPDVINGLTLNDMLGAEALEDDLLLSHLGNSNLNTLASDVSSLTFKQVYPEQIYKLKYFAVLGNVETELSSENNKFYNGSTEIPKEIVYAKYHYTMTKAPGETIWTPANDWIKEDMIEYDPESKYYRHKETKVLLHFELTPQWKYLLVEPDQETHDYKLTEFTKLVDNMTKNMTNATLFDLSGDGIIELTDDTLNTKIMEELHIPGVIDKTFSTAGLADTNGDDKLTLGDLTVTQMMEYTAEVIEAVNSLNNL